MSAVPTYECVIATPAGDAVLEVPTFQGAEAAARRAFWTAVASGWGEPDQVTVISAVRMPSVVAS